MSHENTLCQLLFETAGDAILVMQNDRSDADWICVDGNASAASLFGCEREELLGHSLLDFSSPMQPDGRAADLVLQEKIEAALTGERQRFEWLAKHRRGWSYLTQVALNCLEFGGQTFIQLSVRNISESKQTEQSLRDNEKKFRELADLLPQTVFETDLQGNLTYTNQHGLESTGYTAEDLAQGLNVLQLMAPEDRDQAQHNIGSILRGQAGVPNEYSLLRKDGGGYPVIIYSAPIMRAGAPVGLRGIVVDITERKLTEQKLQESQERFRALFESSPDGIVLIDPHSPTADWAIVDCNEVFCRMNGYQREELIGRTIDILHQERAKPQERVAYLERLRGEGHLTVEAVHCHKDGSLFPIESSTSLISLAGRELVLGIDRDVAERKRLELALQESERRLANIIDFLPYPTFAIDNEGQVIAWNRASEEALGVKAEEMLGKGDYEYALPFYGERRPILIDLVFASPEEIEQNYTNIRRDGQVLSAEATTYPQGQLRYFVVTAAPLYDAQGNLAGAIETFRDISEQRRAEEEVLKFKFGLERSADAVFLTDTEGTINYVNPAFETVYGYDREEAVGQTPRLLKSGLIPPEAYQRFWQNLLAKEPVVGEITNRTKDGRLVTIAASNNPILDQTGNLLGFLSLHRDITEQKQVEEALAESEGRLADIIEFLPSPTFAIDKEGVVISWNQALADVTGVQAGEIMGKGNYEYALPFFGQRRPLLIDLISKSDEEIAKLYTNVWRDGSRLHAENSVTVRGIDRTYALSAGGLYDSQGNLVGAIETFRDITEQKRLDQEIQDSLGSRERQVQLSIDIAQEIALATVEKDLYGRVVSSMMRHLDCSHAQLFRYQAGAPTARVVAGDAQVGSRMLAEDYQIPVGHGSIGAAIATGTSVLKAEIPVDQAWAGHPLLSKTSSELAVPIKVGGENIEAQTRGLDFFLKQNFDGLAVYPIDLDTVRPIARQAIEQGVRVVSLHADLGSGGQNALIQLPDRDMGYKLGIEAGHWAKAHVPPGETLQLGVLNYRANPQVAEREEGIIEGIEAVFEGKIEIVAAEFATDPGQSLSVAERWLKTYPDLRMIVAINDGGALGAYRAVIAADLNDPDRFFVGGIDATDEALNAIQQGGAFQATVDVKPRDTGVLVVRLLVAASQGKPFPMICPIKPMSVNRSNLAVFRQDRLDALAIADALELEQLLVGLDLTGIKLGLSVLNLDNPYFAALAKGAREEAARLGLELVINDPKQVLGALAVQSNEAGALSNEDTLVLAGLSAQLATAFESLRLRQEMADRLNELNALQRLMSYEGWQEFQATRKQAASGYLFDQAAVRPVQREELDIPTNGQAQTESAAEGVADKATGHKAVTKPLAVSGESIGTLGVYEDDPDNPLSAEDQAFLDEVAAQVAETLERARLLEQSRAALAETETLYQAGRRITEAGDLQEILAAVMEVGSIPVINRAILFAFEQDPTGEVETMTVVANWYSGTGTEPTAIGTRYSKTMLTTLNLVLNPEPLFFYDSQHDARIDPATLAVLQRINVRALAVVPLWIGTRQVGALLLEGEETYEFSEQDIRLILSLADQAAVAIDNQRLLQETQTALAEVEATQRRYTVQAWETYRRRKAAIGHEQDREGVPPLGDELPPEVGRALAQKKPRAVSAAAASGGGQASPAGAKSSLMVPLTVRDEVIGVLGLQETAEARQWTPEEIALVEAIAEQVALAAEQIRLFDETQQRAAREQRVGEIGDKIRAAHSLEEALQVAIKEVGLSLKAPQTTVQLEVE